MAWIDTDPVPQGTQMLQVIMGRGMGMWHIGLIIMANMDSKLP